MSFYLLNKILSSLLTVYEPRRRIFIAFLHLHIPHACTVHSYIELMCITYYILHKYLNCCNSATKIYSQYVAVYMHGEDEKKAVLFAFNDDNFVTWYPLKIMLFLELKEENSIQIQGFLQRLEFQFTFFIVLEVEDALEIIGLC